METDPKLTSEGGLTQAEREHVEEFIEVEVDFDQNLEEIGTAGNYDVDVIKKCDGYKLIFLGPGSGKKLVEIGLLRPLGEAKCWQDLTRQLEFFNELLAQEDVGYRYRFASASEALTLGTAKPELQRSQTLLTGAVVLTHNHTFLKEPPYVTPFWLVLLGAEDERALTVTDMAIGVNGEYRLLIVKESEADSLGNQIIADATSSGEVFSKYLLSSHKLVIGDQDLAQIVSEGEYAYADSNITAENFPASEKGEVAVKVDLLDFKRYFKNAEEIVSAVEAVNVWLTSQNAGYRYRFMNVREQLSLQASQPDLQLKYLVAALGSTWVDAEGKKKYLVLGHHDTNLMDDGCSMSTTLRTFVLSAFNKDLGRGWLFGVVREKLMS